MFISNRVLIAMVTQSVITVWTILEQGSPVRDLKHLQVQRILLSYSLVEISVLKPTYSSNTKKVNNLEKKQNKTKKNNQKTMKPPTIQIVRASSNTTLLAVREPLL